MLFVLVIPLIGFAQVDTAVTSQFQQVFEVPVQEILVPTVVEVALPDVEDKRTQFLVVDTVTGNRVASLYDTQFEIEPVFYQVSEAGRILPSLTDDNQSTNKTFPVSADAGGAVTLLVESAEAFSASGIMLDLARNVALPTNVAIEAEVDGDREVVVANTRVNSTRVTFPETVSQFWYITLQYAQPLRINELRFSQTDVDESVEYTLRFLAQPDTTYQVYLDPESYVSLDRIESGNLSSDEEVVVIEEVISVTPNPGFVFSDTDEDGIPDRRDNCVLTANPEQLDVNDNGRGDQCDDFDRDGIINSKDNCVNQPNREQLDEDADGFGDSCDEEESRVTEKYSWIPWAAMGFALFVFALLFIIVLRRVQAEKRKEESDQMIKEPVNDIKQDSL